MPKMQPNVFTTIEFTPEEEKEASILPPLFRLFLISTRGSIAIAKINLKYTPNEPLEFAQQEAFLAGKLELLNQLIGD